MENKEVRSTITKRTLGTALKNLMEHKPLQEITISEITEACGYHRQTFYYHFTEINDLLRWTFEEDVEIFMREHPITGDWENILRTIFLFLSKNQRFCFAAYQALGRNVLIEYFTEDTNRIVYSVILAETRDTPIDAKNAEFITAVISSMLLTHVENWVCGKSVWSTDEIIRQIHYLTEDLIAGAKRRSAELNVSADSAAENR
ncbi:MAG TPA: TetR/AcrR family transcriptional regulator C-terminal domain-containing protein [Methanocorpusculum sp.]|nr:TetR/AcrR family transcriptional regulator C-terminal domain-containing protein [Methanocorpusculum sp.]